MGAKSIVNKLIQSPMFDWSFTISTSMVTTTIDGEFLHGLAVENTPYAKTVYVWNVTLPWFHPSGNRTLDFSSRLDGGAYFVGEPEQVVQRIADVLEADQESRRQIEIGSTLQEFLSRNYRYADFHESHLPTIAFDMAAINALTGNDDVAIRILSELEERRRVYPADDRLRVMTLACLDQLRAGQSIRPVLDPVAAENKASWRITPVKRLAEKLLRRTLPEPSRRIATIRS